MLIIFIKRAKAEVLLSGVVPHLVDDGLSILQYADDTILFMDHNLEQAHNMKTILGAFEQLSGLKINSIRVKSSALEKRIITKVSTWNYLVVTQDLSQFDT